MLPLNMSVYIMSMMLIVLPSQSPSAVPSSPYLFIWDMLPTPDPLSSRDPTGSIFLTFNYVYA